MTKVDAVSATINTINRSEFIEMLQEKLCPNCPKKKDPGTYGECEFGRAAPNSIVVEACSKAVSEYWDRISRTAYGAMVLMNELLAGDDLISTASSSIDRIFFLFCRLGQYLRDEKGFTWRNFDEIEKKTELFWVMPRFLDESSDDYDCPNISYSSLEELARIGLSFVSAGPADPLYKSMLEILR